MSSGEFRKVSPADIQLVKNLIERCIQLYMSQKDVVNTLLVQAKIEPDFTELVWQQLEEENQAFFKAYHMRLQVKDQIVEFNRLLEIQVEMACQIHHPAGVASLPMPNGFQSSPMLQNSSCFATGQTGPALNPDNMQQLVGTRLPNAFTNGGSALHPSMQSAVNMSAHARRSDVLPNMLLAQRSNFGMIQGMNAGLIKSNTGYAGISQFRLSANGNVLHSRPAIGDASGSSFNSAKSNLQPLNETIKSNWQPLNETVLDADASSFGILGQIPRNFSLSDLTAGFSNDILESYSRSPFQATDADNFLNPYRGGEQQGDIKRLDTTSEGLSYEGFGSD